MQRWLRITVSLRSLCHHNVNGGANACDGDAGMDNLARGETGKMTG